MSATKRPYIDSYREEGSSVWVWDSLLAEGPLEEGTPLWQDAYDVARETVQRALTNVHVIVEHLSAIGYRFGFVSWEWHDSAPLEPPSAETQRHIAELQARIGPVPVALRACWEIMGGVNLCGTFPDAQEDTTLYTDALVVFTVEDALAELSELETSMELQDRPYEAPIAPDIFHKANYSGGVSYGIRLPDPRADAPLRNMISFLATPAGDPDIPIGMSETFIGHLRRSFVWAGFPGYALLRGARARKEIDRLRPLFERMLPI